MDLQDKTIWITGASSGIGKALALQLSMTGANLILSSRDRNALEAVRSLCKNSDRHRVVPLDLEKLNELPGQVNSVLASNQIDVLVNNAGLSQRYLASEGDFSLDQRLLNLDLLSPILLTKLVLPQMIKRGVQTQIVVVSSVMGLYSIHTRTAYCAAKHGLRGYFEALRSELSKTKVGILLVYPGYIRTNVSLNAITKTGQPHGSMDVGQAKGIDAEVCATKIVQAMKANRAQVEVVSINERIAILLSRHLPSVFRKIMPGIPV